MGRDTAIVGAHFKLDGDGKIFIGERCLFGDKVLFLTSDGHSIIDMDTKDVLTKSGGCISIGNNVWIGSEVMFLKDSGVGNDCVIGARALLNKKFIESNVVLVGIPAKIVKRKINWLVETPYMIERGIFTNSPINKGVKK